jgi:hypothetical protein
MLGVRCAQHDIPQLLQPPRDRHALLIDSSLTLDWWTRPSGGEASYMGNWGGTKDRWYRRAAIVMWTRERSFAAQAEASGLWALDELRRLADAGDLAAARAAASSAESFRSASVSAQPLAFERAMNVALILDAPETATMLLRPFRVEMLTPDHAGALLALAGHYGPEWMSGMLAVWFGERSRADWPASGLDTLASLCASRLGELIARPVRAEDDWAIAWRDTCGCELCVPFGEFLGDGSRRTLEWPLAEARRKHIQQSIRAAELPVRHQTLRAGSPYTLILTKTDALFERERKARQRAITDLAWLNESWPAAD